MIAKITRGADGAGLVRYLMGEGRAEEHTDQRVIAAADMVVVPIGTALSPEEVGELGRQLDAARTLYGTEVADGHVWHLALSNPAGDRQLSDTEWAGVVRDAMSRLGFSEASGKAPCRWVAVRHGRSAGGHDHVHGPCLWYARTARRRPSGVTACGCRSCAPRAKRASVSPLSTGVSAAVCQVRAGRKSRRQRAGAGPSPSG